MQNQNYTMIRGGQLIPVKIEKIVDIYWADSKVDFNDFTKYNLSLDKKSVETYINNCPKGSCTLAKRKLGLIEGRYYTIRPDRIIIGTPISKELQNKINNLF